MQCQSPQAIENGQYDMQEDPDRQYEYGDGVYYNCKPGFTLIGSDVIKCSDDGEFHPEPPKCIGKLLLNAYKQLSLDLFFCLGYMPQ